MDEIRESMSEPIPESGAAPKWQPLDARQRRVLGVLIEKAKTTPAGYPMTVNAIVTACNQKSNRHPLMTLDDFGVEKALDELRNMGAVSEVDWVGRVSKWKHNAYEWLGVDKPEIAVMTELLLRGEQSLGDLRGRASRLEPIADLAALKPVVETLVARGLMIELTPPGRGQIVSHGLYTEPELAELRAQHGGGGRPRTWMENVESADREAAESGEGIASSPPRRSAPAIASPADVAGLTAQIAELRGELERLRERVAGLESKLEIT